MQILFPRPLKCKWRPVLVSLCNNDNISTVTCILKCLLLAVFHVFAKSPSSFCLNADFSYLLNFAPFALKFWGSSCGFWMRGDQTDNRWDPCTPTQSSVRLIYTGALRSIQFHRYVLVRCRLTLCSHNSSVWLSRERRKPEGNEQLWNGDGKCWNAATGATLLGRCNAQVFYSARMWYILVHSIETCTTIVRHLRGHCSLCW